MHARLQEEVKLKAELAAPVAELQAAARTIAEVQRECKLEVDPDAYVESFRPYLMDIIHAWSKVRRRSSSAARVPEGMAGHSCACWAHALQEGMQRWQAGLGRRPRA